MNKSKVWTEEKIAGIAEMGKTMTIREISDKTGYSYSRINGICLENDIKTVPHRRKFGKEINGAKSDMDYSFLCMRWVL